MNIERLAELINEKWPESSAHIGTQGVVIYLEVTCSTGRLDYEPGAVDETNGRWIIWCLDRLEELGLNPQLVVTIDGYMLRSRYGVITQAPTRAEACALALMAALEGK